MLVPDWRNAKFGISNRISHCTFSEFMQCLSTDLFLHKFISRNTCSSFSAHPTCAHIRIFGLEMGQFWFCFQIQHVCKTLSDDTHFKVNYWREIEEVFLLYIPANVPHSSISNIVLVSHSGPYPTTFNVSGKADAGCRSCWIRYYSAIALTLARFFKLLLLALSWGVGLVMSPSPCIRGGSSGEDHAPHCHPVPQLLTSQ